MKLLHSTGPFDVVLVVAATLFMSQLVQKDGLHVPGREYLRLSNVYENEVLVGKRHSEPVCKG